MQDISMQDIFVVLGACIVAWFIGKYIKRKNERELREEMEAKLAQEAANESNVEVLDVESTEQNDLSSGNEQRETIEK